MVVAGNLLGGVWGGDGGGDRKGELVSQLVDVFKPSQPPGILSGLKETFIKRDIVERTSKAEIGPEEQSDKAESC